MKHTKHVRLDCSTYADAVASLVLVEELEDLTGKVPHVGYGGASKSMYMSPKTGLPVYVLERNAVYASDAYYNDVWIFDQDFKAEEVNVFLTQWDTEQRNNHVL